MPGSWSRRPVLREPDDRRATADGAAPAAADFVGLDAGDFKNRNVIERRFCHLKQWRGLATRYEKHATIYCAAVLLHAAIAWTQALSDTR